MVDAIRRVLLRNTDGHAAGDAGNGDPAMRPLPDVQLDADLYPVGADAVILPAASQALRAAERELSAA